MLFDYWPLQGLNGPRDMKKARQGLSYAQVIFCKLICSVFKRPANISLRIMPPSCPHAVFTPDDCLAVGGNFYTTAHLGSTLRGLKLQEDYPEICNEDLRPDFYKLLRSIFENMSDISSTQQADILSSSSLFLDTLDAAYLATLLKTNRRGSYSHGLNDHHSRVCERLESQLTNQNHHLMQTRTLFISALDGFQKRITKSWEGE